MMNYIPIVDGVFKGRCKGSGSSFHGGELIGIMKDKDQCLKKCMTREDATGCTYIVQDVFQLSDDGSCSVYTDEVVEGAGAFLNETCWKLITKGVVWI